MRFGGGHDTVTLNSTALGLLHLVDAGFAKSDTFNDPLGFANYLIDRPADWTVVS